MMKIAHHIQTRSKRMNERGISKTKGARRKKRCQNYHRQGRLQKQKMSSGKDKVHPHQFCPNRVSKHRKRCMQFF
eukprot:9373110-Karenia_brevis.AAC.1